MNDVNTSQQLPLGLGEDRNKAMARLPPSQSGALPALHSPQTHFSDTESPMQSSMEQGGLRSAFATPPSMPAAHAMHSPHQGPSQQQHYPPVGAFPSPFQRHGSYNPPPAYQRTLTVNSMSPYTSPYTPAADCVNYRAPDRPVARHHYNNGRIDPPMFALSSRHSLSPTNPPAVHYPSGAYIITPTEADPLVRKSSKMPQGRYTRGGMRLHKLGSGLAFLLSGLLLTVGLITLTFDTDVAPRLSKSVQTLHRFSSSDNLNIARAKECYAGNCEPPKEAKTEPTAISGDKAAGDAPEAAGGDVPVADAVAPSSVDVELAAASGSAEEVLQEIIHDRRHSKFVLGVTSIVISSIGLFLEITLLAFGRLKPHWSSHLRKRASVYALCGCGSFIALWYGGLLIGLSVMLYYMVAILYFVGSLRGEGLGVPRRRCGVQR